MGIFRRLCTRYNAIVSSTMATAWCAAASAVGTASNSVETPSVPAMNTADTVHGIRGSVMVTESSSDRDRFTGARSRSGSSSR